MRRKIAAIFVAFLMLSGIAWAGTPVLYVLSANSGGLAKVNKWYVLTLHKQSNTDFMSLWAGVGGKYCVASNVSDLCHYLIKVFDKPSI